MVKLNIESFKKAGAYKHLLEQCGTRLWDAQRACENAKKENFSSFAKELKRAREALDGAEQLFNAAAELG